MLLIDLGVINCDGSDLGLIFQKFIGLMLFCCSRIAIGVSIKFQALEGKKMVKMYFFFYNLFRCVCSLCLHFCDCYQYLLTSFLKLPV